MPVVVTIHLQKHATKKVIGDINPRVMQGRPNAIRDLDVCLFLSDCAIHK